MHLPRSRRGRLLAAGLILVIAVGIAWLITRPASSTAATTTTSLVAAATTTMRQTVATTGTAAYATTSDQSFTVGGTVASVPVTVGASVHAGDVLATVNSAALASALAQANSTLATAQAKVASDTSASSTQLAADQAAVSAAQAAVASAQADLSKATLTSPIDGTVSVVNLTPGEQLGSTGAAAGGSGSGAAAGGSAASGGGSSGGGSSGSGSSGGGSSASSSSAQVEVVSTGHYVVAATVDDTQVGQLASGQTAGITLADGSVTSGTVTSVGMVASSTSGVASFPVVVTVTGTPTGLYPGSVLPVVVVTKTVPDALAVPVAALHRTTSGTTVTVDKNGTRTTRTVSTGLVSGGQVQITDGLTEGEKVVVTTVRVTAPAGTSGASRTGGSGGGGGFGGGGGGFGGGGGGGGSRGAGGGGD